MGNAKGRLTAPGGAGPSPSRRGPRASRPAGPTGRHEHQQRRGVGQHTASGLEIARPPSPSSRSRPKKARWPSPAGATPSARASPPRLRRCGTKLSKAASAARSAAGSTACSRGRQPGSRRRRGERGGVRGGERKATSSRRGAGPGRARGRPGAGEAAAAGTSAARARFSLRTWGAAVPSARPAAHGGTRIGRQNRQPKSRALTPASRCPECTAAPSKHASTPPSPRSPASPPRTVTSFMPSPAAAASSSASVTAARSRVPSQSAKEGRPRARARQPRPTSASHAGTAASAMARRPRARSVGAGRRRADPTFGGTGFRWSAQRLAKQKCVQPVEQTGAHNGWRNRSLGIGTRWFTGSCFRRFETALRNQTGPPAMVPAGAQVHRYGGNRAPTHQRGSGRFLTQAPPAPQARRIFQARFCRPKD